MCIRDRSRTFRGLGDQKTVGKRICHLGFEANTSCGDVRRQIPNVWINAKIQSHELEHGENLMLLSLAAQGTMGLVKDVEAGTCFMKNEKVWVQLYTVAGSSLRAIVVFDPKWKNAMLDVIESSEESASEESSQPPVVKHRLGTHNNRKR